MFQLTSKKQLRDLYAVKTRTLHEAAAAAHMIAEAENLPINGTPQGSSEIWHRETLLKMVPVYGTRADKSEQVPAGVRLEGDHAIGDNAVEWTELTVKGADFKRYLDWLHSIW